MEDQHNATGVVTILGMQPLTAIIVGVIALLGIGIGVTVALTHKK